MKTILVPTDFSKCSIQALKFASNVAELSGATIHLISIIERQNYYFMGGEPIVIPPPLLSTQSKHDEKLKKVIKKKLIELSRDPYFSLIKIICKVGSGLKAYKSINEYAQISKADMIIMGTTGAHGIREIFLGSNSERVARFSKIPVVILTRQPKNIKTIVFASDFEKESYRIFPFVQNFAKLFNADIHLLSINDGKKFKKIDERNSLKLFNKKFKSHYKEIVFDCINITEGIVKYSDKVRADMIAIGTHGKKGIVRLLMEDVSEQTIRFSQRPVMTVRF